MRIAFVATIHDAAARRVTFGQGSSAELRLLDGAGNLLARFDAGTSGRAEAALILGELYRRGSEWKIRAVGQGFAGGLGPLATSFGVDIGDSAPPPPPPVSTARPAPVSTARPSPVSTARPSPVDTSRPSRVDTSRPAAVDTSRPSRVDTSRPAPSSNVRLEKRLVELEKKDAQLVSLVKKVQVQLEKKNLATDRAKVALCLDISGSMSMLYRTGQIDHLVQRVMALGYRFDDDGEIDVFLFDDKAHSYGTVNVDTYRGFVAAMQRNYSLGGGTNYGGVMSMIRQHYRRQADFGAMPVYVMFVTDGDTGDPDVSELQIREASREGIFWQFMAIGEKKKGWFGGSSGGFDFLEKLDTMSGRTVDNANFFMVKDPKQPTDEQLFELLMAEYPSWLNLARGAGILRF